MGQFGQIYRPFDSLVHGQHFTAWIGGPGDGTLYELSISIGLLEGGVFFPGLHD